MDCPYKKPSYLTEEESKNCYATNRGWVILKPQGKYDIVESIAGLDDKIKNWEKANGIDTPVNDIPKEFKLAMKKHDKTVLEHELEVVKGQLAEVSKEIAKVEEKLPVLKDEPKPKEEKPVKEVKEAVKEPVKEEKAPESDSQGESDAE